MSIHQGHRLRVRKKFLDSGLSSMSPHEILEFLLFFSVPQKNTNEMGHELIDTFGSISGVFDASFADLCKVKGITEYSATLIKAIPELFRVYNESLSTHNLLNTSTKIGAFLMPKFIGRTSETVILTLLDNRHSVIRSDVLFVGSVNQVHMNLRKIVDLCVTHNAAGIILAHNHPNGFALPSNADISSTEKLNLILEPLGIVFIDHIIVADNDFVSMRDSGFFK